MVAARGKIGTTLTVGVTQQTHAPNRFKIALFVPNKYRYTRNHVWYKTTLNMARIPVMDWTQVNIAETFSCLNNPFNSFVPMKKSKGRKNPLKIKRGIGNEGL